MGPARARCARLAGTTRPNGCDLAGRCLPRRSWIIVATLRAAARPRLAACEQTRRNIMPRAHFVVATALATAALVATAQAQTPPPFATTKVDGTENVYVFGYGGHQAMFIVTPQGVIATNPIGLRRPAAKTYIEEIQKITKAPIKGPQKGYCDGLGALDPWASRP